MRAQSIGSAASGVALTEDSGTVGKCVSNGRTKLPKDLTQVFLEVLVDLDVLIMAEVLMRQIRKTAYFAQLSIIFPAWW